jgi:hypothetical protein
LVFGPTALAQDRPLDLSLDPEFANPPAPAVTIEDYDNRTTEEYRVNGNLYMIKVNPTAGPSYYLVDPDGGGEFEWRRNTPSAELNVPQWALLQW